MIVVVSSDIDRYIGSREMLLGMLTISAIPRRYPSSLSVSLSHIVVVPLFVRSSAEGPIYPSDSRYSAVFARRMEGSRRRWTFGGGYGTEEFFVGVAASVGREAGVSDARGL